MRTIGIIGGSGFVGTYLVDLLVNDGHKVVIFSRSAKIISPNPLISYVSYDYTKKSCDINALKQLDAVVNLAGAGVADKRWTKQRKEEIVASRVDNTNFLVAQLRQYAPNCKTFIAASATGFYGPDSPGNTPPFTEDAPPYTDFLGETCQKWENASLQGASFMRTVILRTGIVLGKESGAFPEFIKPMAFGVVPILGSGNQAVSWIEVTDHTRIIAFALTNDQLSGIYNSVAPAPVTHKQLMKTIAWVKGGVKIPVPVPAFLLRIAIGELSTEVLKSCNASAQKILKTGFTFHYPAISDAITHILNGSAV